MEPCVESRLAKLEASQNPDGGWGYFPGRPSWLEPTAYALLALSERRGPAYERGWRLLRSWQIPCGAWRPCAAVDQPHWSTSLALTLHSVAGVRDAAFQRGFDWLLTSAGAEGRMAARIAHWLCPSIVEFDPGLAGWPWEAGASSWVEPTAHALMALRCAARRTKDPAWTGRMAMSERMLLDRRCRDGGWNYGNRRVLGADLPSYPETTALALMALDGHAAVAWGAALDGVERTWRDTRSPLAQAWLSSCLLMYRGERPRRAQTDERAENDMLVTAIEGIPWNHILAG
ncbi:MAG: terpene cyclase/mutase family protein [Acidobacteriia bacterium]|nr:terpene cyclase/mutase family protein [Terriglobia bacterium]